MVGSANRSVRGVPGSCSAAGARSSIGSAARSSILAVLLALASTVLAVKASDSLSSGGWLDANSESAGVAARLDTEFGAGKSSVIALFRSDAADADATSAAFQAAIATSVAGLADDPRVTGIVGYKETGDRRFISTRGDAAYVVIELGMTNEASVAAVDDLRAGITPPAGYHAQLTGYGPITRDSAKQSEKDLQKAETVSLPIAALVLLTVFASIVAAGMPLLVAGLAIPSSLALVWIVAQQVEMSIFVLNIATMLGLALAIDYSLFIVSRYREELRRGRTVGEAVERAVATSGKAVAFSGIAVAIGLSGLLLFAASAIRSIGIGGALVVAVLRRVRAHLPARRPRHARPPRQRPERGRPAPPHPARARHARGPPRRRAGSGWPAGSCATRSPSSSPTLARAARRRFAVPAPGAGRARRRHLPRRGREPGRLRGPPGGVPSRRDDADHHPRRRAGLPDRPRDHRGHDRVRRDHREAGRHRSR